MKISELMKKLDEVGQREGDLEVLLADGVDYETHQMSITDELKIGILALFHPVQQKHLIISAHIESDCNQIPDPNGPQLSVVKPGRLTPTGEGYT